MSFISRGFRGRRVADAPRDRVPPGQYVTRDYPVLSAGPTPHTPIEKWDFYKAVATPDHVLTIQTADQQRFANLLLTIGVRMD